MSKNSYFFLLAIFFLFSVEVKSLSYPNGDLTTIINGASAGEVINLTGNAYTYTVPATLDKSITIQSTISPRPVITCGFATSAYFFTAAAAVDQSLTLKGLVFDANKKALGLTLSNANAKFTVSVQSCKASNFLNTSANTGRMFSYATSTNYTTNGDLTLLDSEFTGTYPKAILTSTLAGTAPTNISVQNCFFLDFSTATNTFEVSSAITKPASIIFNHCTFKNCSSGAKSPFSLPVSGVTTSIVQNSIFLDILGTSNLNTQTNLTLNNHNAVFNSGAIYDANEVLLTRWIKLVGEDLLLYTEDPAEGIDGITTASAYIEKGTDGRTIGYYGLPTVPKAPIITSTLVRSVSVTIGFTAACDGGSVITNFEYSTNNGTTWIARSPISTASPLVISGLTNGTAYNVMIRAVNAIGKGATTSSVSLTPMATILPGVPTINKILASDRRLSIVFTAGTDGYTDITNYSYSTNGGGKWTTRSPASNMSPIVITGLTNGTSYNVQIRAINSKGNSPATSSVSAKPNATTFDLDATNAIDSRIATKHDPLVNKAVYTLQDHVGGKFTRNVNCWAGDLDLTCISPSNSYSAGRKAGTLITPRHCILVAHFHYFAGDKISFVTKNNVVVTRTIISSIVNNSAGNSPDISIVTLDADINPSDGIVPCKFLPANYIDYISNDGNQLPAFYTDRDESACIGDIDYMASASSFPLYIVNLPTDPNRAVFQKAAVSGDSGNPVFLILRNELVLFGCITWAYTYPIAIMGNGLNYYANLADKPEAERTYPNISLNDLIAEVDKKVGANTGYKITKFDFNPLITDAKRLESSNLAKVYATGRTLKVIITDVEKRAKVQVCNSLGEVIVNQVVENQQLNYELPSNGVYIVTISDGAYSKSYKILVK